MSAGARLRAWLSARAELLTALGLLGMAAFVLSLLATSLGLLGVVDHLGASALSLGIYTLAMALARFGQAPRRPLTPALRRRQPRLRQLLHTPSSS